MADNLVVVESPAKAETIKRYLGKNFEVLASYGHVRELPSKGGSAVNPIADFEMSYSISERSTKHVNAIVKAVKKANALYLATDLDREGEAISWHIVEILQDKKILKEKSVHRVVFNEITKSAIKKAMDDPKEISMDLVNAQQARRALDYLVGFNLSPLLWKKIKPGLSAGRVQSPALRLICEREEEIEKFKPVEYWTIHADIIFEGQEFEAELKEYQGKKLKKFDLPNLAKVETAKKSLETSSQGVFVVKSVEKKRRKKNPSPPFITSTLQQESIRKLGFTAQRTMRVAQQLYEGIPIGSETVGLITYMRTDSISLSEQSLQELREYVCDKFSPSDIPDEVRLFKTRSKNAQEAHEAIRPTSFHRDLEVVKQFLNEEQLKLYTLIWNRAVASQMIQAIYEDMHILFDCGSEGVFRSNGSRLIEPGFEKVYLSSEDKNDKTRLLPELKQGDSVKTKGITSDQHFTEPPARYGEARLVKTLEEFGIGRPSTYATIISTLLQREYVELENKRFFPTDVGKLVSGFLTNHFADYVDYEFTAQLEDELDAISRGEAKWIKVLGEFWGDFEKTVKNKETVSRGEVQRERHIGTHPKNGKPVSVRMGRYGPYVIIGDIESEEKPSFHGIPPGMKMDEITIEDVIEITQLPRFLGEDSEGIEYSANRGRFGPYVMYSEKADQTKAQKAKKKPTKPKAKYVSLESSDDPYTITFERAIELVENKKKADAEKKIQVFPEIGLEVLNGRFGPYITDGKKNAKIPKDVEPSKLTAEECIKILEEAPVRKYRPKKRKTK